MNDPHRTRFPFSVAQAYLEMVYPPACTLCGAALLQRTPIEMCDGCIDAVKGSCRDWCRKCGMPMEPARIGEPNCNRCVKQRFAFQEVTVLGRYEDAAREAVIAGKKYFYESLTMSMGRMLGEQIRQQMLQPPDVVTYIPSHWRRQLGRGTVPAATLAHQVGRVIARPVNKVLRCVRATTKQATLSADKRVTNISEAFAVRKWYRCRGRSFLVIDDVMTTGATFNEAARVLRAAGADYVSVAATARGEGKT